MISPLFFTNTVTLSRPVITKDGAGGAVRAWTDVPDSIAITAAVQPSSPSDISLYAGRNIQISHSVYVEQDLGFQRGDRLVTNDGRIFSIRGVINYASFNLIYKLVCRQILE